MKTLTVRLPVKMASEIEAESRLRKVSKSDVVRERLGQYKTAGPLSMKNLLGDLIGSVGGLPVDLSSNKKKYLSKFIHAKKGIGR